MSALEGRKTSQRDAIERALARADRFVSAQQLHQLLEEDGSPVGLATVYRHLHALAGAGAADTISVDGESLYKSCVGSSHHHHVVCEECGVSEEIDPPESWMQSAAVTRGFTVTRHVIEMYGVCNDCDAQPR